MSQTESLTLPLNSPGIITPLEAFRQDIEALANDQTDLNFVQQEFYGRTEARASYGPPTGQTDAFEPGISVNVKVWVPTPEPLAEITTPDPFIIINTGLRKLLGTKEHPIQSTQTRSFGLHRIIDLSDSSGIIQRMWVSSEDTLTTHQRSAAGSYETTKASRKETDVWTRSELDQRLHWAVGMLNKTLKQG